MCESNNRTRCLAMLKKEQKRKKNATNCSIQLLYIYVGFFWGGFLCWCHYLQAPSSLQPPATFIETIKKESARGLNSIWRPAKNNADCVFSRRTLQPRDLVTRLRFCCCWRQQVTNIHICNCADFHSVLFAEFQRPRGHTRHLESVGGSAAALFSWYVAHSPRTHRLAFSMCSRERVRERETLPANSQPFVSPAQWNADTHEWTALHARPWFL